jgi:transposase
MSAHSVGFVAASTSKAAIDDAMRFRHSGTVTAHFGFTPRRFQSGAAQTATSVLVWRYSG